MKMLEVTVIFKNVGQSSIMVPKELSLDDAILYAKSHISEIPTPTQSEYICDSDELDEENCDFADGN